MSVMCVEERKLAETSSLCTVCREGVPAEIVERDEKIYMKKNCEHHGCSEVILSTDAKWYHDMMNMPAELKPPTYIKNEVEAGCPFDCGACASHEQAVYLPVIPITSACDLDCPICYTVNRNKEPFHISLDEVSRILEVIGENNPHKHILNLTGGEPTQHPHLPEIVRLCRDAGIQRVTISTHGLGFLKREELLPELAELGARIVLSFDSFDENTNSRMLGARLGESKLKVIELLEKYDVDTTLIPVVALGVNEQEIGEFIELMYRTPCIRNVEIHTMTYTGQGGDSFDPGTRITTPDVLKLIEESSGGAIKVGDFIPSPCAHPLCYLTCYLLETAEGGSIPFTRFMSRERMRHLLSDNLYIEPGEKLERVLQDVINELWASESLTGTEESILKTLKHVLRKLYPSHELSVRERQYISGRSARAIYVHAHMDQENFDTDRIKQCCVGIPSADGGNVPACSYNILYRARNSHFSRVPMKPLEQFTGGRRWEQK